MQIEINGGLRIKRGSIVLTIYSSPFARYLLTKNIDHVAVQFLKEVIEIYKGKEKKIIFERKREKHPLAIMYLTKIAPEETKKELMNLKKQKPIKVIVKKFITQNELRKYNERLSYIKPKKIELNDDNLFKVGCFVSCYRQNDKIWYRFNIRHRILEEIWKRKQKVAICRKGNCFFIVKDNGGKEFKFYKNKKGYPLVYTQISPDFLREKEKILFMNGRRAISFRAFLSAKDFELDISQFFSNEEERSLAKALLKRKVKIQIPEMRKREADIILPDKNVQIEITRISPRIHEKTKNNPHSEGVHINARACEGFLRVNKKQIRKFILVFDERWTKCGWVKDLSEMVKPNVITLPTNFQEGWEEDVANKIQKNLR